MPAPDLTTQGPRITLRALEPTDVDLLYAWENNPVLWDAGSTIAPFSRRQLWDYVNNYDADIYSARQLRLMITLTDTRETIGTLDLYEFDPANSRCWVGIYVDAPHQHKGYAAEAINLISDRLGRILSLHQLTALVGVGNTASRALFSQCGFTPVATLPDWLCRRGIYQDAIVYAKKIV